MLKVDLGEKSVRQGTGCSLTSRQYRGWLLQICKTKWEHAVLVHFCPDPSLSLAIRGCLAGVITTLQYSIL